MKVHRGIMIKPNQIKIKKLKGSKVSVTFHKYSEFGVQRHKKQLYDMFDRGKEILLIKKIKS